MQREYFVIHDSGEEPHTFSSLPKAMKCAEGIARADPGQTVVIAETCFWVKCPAEKPKMQVHPLKKRKPENDRRTSPPVMASKGNAKDNQRAGE